jgi:hypothetical protein
VITYPKLRRFALKKAENPILLRLIYAFGLLPEYNARTYFIIGSGRCGTTLLTKVLRSHPHIFMHLGEFNEIWHPKLYPFNERKVEFEHPIELGIEEFTKKSKSSWPRNYRNHIKRLIAFRWWKNGKPEIFVIKSSMISYLLDELLSIFPDAKFIHIYRYGPSVLKSYVEKNFEKYEDLNVPFAEYVSKTSKYWVDCLEKIERSKRELQLTENKKLFEFSYESFCENPRKLLNTLSDFLKVDSLKYTFPLETIKSQNWKVREIGESKEYNDAFTIMKDLLKKLEYH